MSASYRPVRAEEHGWVPEERGWISEERGWISEERGWASIAIRPWSLLAFSLVAAAILIGIIVLLVLSRLHDGFVAIEGDDFSVLGLRWRFALLWTTLPTFIFRLVVAYWDAIVAAHVDRQPYVELSRSPQTNGVSIKKSIMLDYRTVMAPWRWCAAFKNHHVLIGFSILLGLIFSFIVTPFAASLIVPKLHLRESAVSVLQLTRYDELGLNSTTNWGPVFDKISAVLVNGGERQAWTTGELAFPAFSLEHAALVPQSNVSVTTNGTSAYLDCRMIEDYSSSVLSTVDILTRVAIAGSDRGCTFEQEFGVANTTAIYLETISVRDCPLDAFESRLIFTGGRYSGDLAVPLEDISVISCIAGYATRQGRLMFDLASNTAGLSFSPTHDRHLQRHRYADVIESNMFLSTDFSLNSAWSTSHFGSIVLSLASQHDSANFLGSDLLVQNIRKVFTTAYLTGAAMNSFSQQVDAITLPGILLEPQTRLFVVEWVAALSVVTLAACLFMRGLVYRHLRKNHTFLAKEPQGLLSAAGILHGSVAFETLLGNDCASSGYDGRIVKHVESCYDTVGSKCILLVRARSCTSRGQY